MKQNMFKLNIARKPKSSRLAICSLGTNGLKNDEMRQHGLDKTHRGRGLNPEIKCSNAVRQNLICYPCQPSSCGNRVSQGQSPQPAQPAKLRWYRTSEMVAIPLNFGDHFGLDSHTRSRRHGFQVSACCQYCSDFTSQC